MPESAAPAMRRGFLSIVEWRRVRFALGASIILGLLMSLGWKSGPLTIVVRSVVLGMIAMVVFGVFEQWPKQLPAWLQRWVLQVAAVGLAMPIATFATYILTTETGAPPFWHDQDRLEGFAVLTFVAMLLAPWAALAALMRKLDTFARHQAQAFELERSELAREALDARLHLLQAQVAPHFLFNTLANIQALVDTGSPQASAVLRSLIAYLRASVPLLHEPSATLGQELELVRAYLELMHMRMPDRLQFELHVDPSAVALRCPPITLLTLVENAVRHGIDPTEDGGRIDIHVERRGDRCLMRVIDTGAGLQHGGDGAGTGLASLHQRLQVIFDGDAHLRLTAQGPRGVSAELEIPARGDAK